MLSLVLRAVDGLEDDAVGLVRRHAKEQTETDGRRVDQRCAPIYGTAAVARATPKSPAACADETLNTQVCEIATAARGGLDPRHFALRCPLDRHRRRLSLPCGVACRSRCRVGPAGPKRIIVAAWLLLPVNTAGARVGSDPAVARPAAQGGRALCGEPIEGSAVPAGPRGWLVRVIHAGDARQPLVHSVSYRR